MVLSIGAGAAALAPRALPGAFDRVLVGSAIVVVFLLATLAAHRSAKLRPFWTLSFAFLIFAVVQVLNNSLPSLVETHLLHESAVTGDPLGSTIVGTVTIQLLETAIAVVPILALTRASGQSMGSIYARTGKVGGWLIVSVGIFVLLYFVAASGHLGRIFPTDGSVTLARTVPLTPALLLLVLSNGFQEEFLFRGLFLQKYVTTMGVRVALLVQAIVFAVAHLGVTYTPSAIVFVLLFVFPLGLLFGYVMRSSNGVLAPAILHAGYDIPIYLAFLTYVS